MSIFLGIDPGTTDTGFAVIKMHSHGNYTLLQYGVIHTLPRKSIGEKMQEIEQDIIALIEQYKITACGIEKIFYSNNQKTVIDVAQSRGVVFNAIYRSGIPVLEYSPPEIKKAITGNGRANKKQVQNTIQMLFKLKEIPKPDDAADALAIAYITSLQKNFS